MPGQDYTTMEQQPEMFSNLKLSSKLETDHQAERNALLSSLRGQTIRIPDLVPLFKHWPTKTNSGLDRILHELQITDVGIFSSKIWPCAAPEKLQIVAYLSIWLFKWDDEIDHSDGTLWGEFGAAQIYRDQTLEYMAVSLGLHDGSHDPAITNPIILGFGPIAAALEKSYTLEQ
ncbi:hypothetical protein CC86DRAFT_408494 [Ophiobolus disseminans]|uniref:Terpenoid synthase n=1 Tax=Ophiobolus disseminans TaxID=1469910 RepID=A0A6A6ZUC6_9PLEO|nr:hypothetical protein CC86DRAFT_408494 [Ophiobolus disseminans]